MEILFLNNLILQGNFVSLNFYSAYNFFRIAAILQGIAGRVRDGTAASSEAMRIVKAVEPLAKIGSSYAAKVRV